MEERREARPGTPRRAWDSASCLKQLSTVSGVGLEARAHERSPIFVSSLGAVISGSSSAGGTSQGAPDAIFGLRCGARAAL